MHWRVVQDPAGNGPDNMAADVALLAEAEGGASTLRFYSWEGAWVSLGRFQSAERDLLDPSLVPWVQRPTGGKAVLHGHDLTITLACPNPGKGVREVYRMLIRPIVQGLNACGQPAALGEDTPFVGTGATADCFRHLSANDVADPNTGRKLVGCALKVTRRSALAQCSIPLTKPLVDPATVYREAHVAVPLDVPREELIIQVAAALSVAM